MALSITIYPSAIEYMADGTIDLDNDTFKVILLNSSHAYSNTHTQLSDISANELSTANGYTSGGATLSSVTWTRSGNNVDFDAANVTWIASGGSIGPVDYAAIYDYTTPNDELLCHIDLDGSLIAVNGATFYLNFNASGIFRAS